jgi:hypothetical protein
LWEAEKEIRLKLSENVTRTVSVDITFNARNKVCGERSTWKL